MSLRDGLAVLLVLCGTTMPTRAADDAAWGRMICDVTGSRIVWADDARSELVSRQREEFPAGTEFSFEYGLDDASGLTIRLSETGERNVLIEETFPANRFGGISEVTTLAEFAATYSEATFGQHRINYKGSDQLFLKNRCQGKGWSGHFVQTHLSGLFTRVVALDCRSFVDARAEVLTRLRAAR